MKYLGAYMLAVMGGNESPDASAIKKILDSAGVEFEENVLDKVLSELSGKNVYDVIEQGKSKLASVPAGGGAAGGGGGGAAAAGNDAPAEEAPKEEEKEESEEEEEDMDFDLFD